MADTNTSEKPEKLLIDNIADFRFHTAYMVYDKTWAENPSEEVRLELNRLLLSLKEQDRDYTVFYNQINRYRKDTSSSAPHRIDFRADRKKDWRKKEANKERIGRYRK